MRGVVVGERHIGIYMETRLRLWIGYGDEVRFAVQVLVEVRLRRGGPFKSNVWYCSCLLLAMT
jgi:hypothetical protein